MFVTHVGGLHALQEKVGLQDESEIPIQVAAAVIAHSLHILFGHKWMYFQLRSNVHFLRELPRMTAQQLREKLEKLEYDEHRRIFLYIPHHVVDDPVTLRMVAGAQAVHEFKHVELLVHIDHLKYDLGRDLPVLIPSHVQENLLQLALYQGQIGSEIGCEDALRLR